MNNATVIIATGGANLSSLKFALGRLGVNACITENPQKIKNANHVILPGVGSASDAMGRLSKAGLVDTIRSLTQPVLGICLGLQLLFTHSDENNASCLGIIPGRAARFLENPDLPVPQMGWNSLTGLKDIPLLEGVKDGDYAYFIHSYALPVDEYTCASAVYGFPFSAVIQYKNFLATQFHPERSSHIGSLILKNFLNS